MNKMKINKKTLSVFVAVIALVILVAVVFVSLRGMQTEDTLSENQSYVYAYVSRIQGNEITYATLEEAVVTAYLEQQESWEEAETEEDGADSSEEAGGDFDGEKPSGEAGGDFDGEKPSGEAGRDFDGEKPSGEAGRDFDGEKPSGEMPSGDASGVSADNKSSQMVTTFIPVGVVVHTQSDAETTFQRLASGDMIKMIVETTEEGEEVITEIWML